MFLCIIGSHNQRDHKSASNKIESYSTPSRCLTICFLMQAIDKFGFGDALCGVNVDACPTNTGIHGGVLRLTEVNLGRALQWIVCLLHLTELIFRSLFIQIGKNLLNANLNFD